MVPDDFTGYFAAAGTAAGALIGLLFVAVSLRPETVLGRGASRSAAGNGLGAPLLQLFENVLHDAPATG